MVSPQNEDAPSDEIVDDTASPPPPPPPRKRSLIGRLFKSVALLALIAGGTGYGAIAFRDADPRIAVVADYVEQGVGEARGLLDRLNGESGQPSTDAMATHHATIGENAAPAASEPTPAEPAAPQLDDDAVRKAQRDAEEAVKAAEAKAQAEADAHARAEEEARAAEAKASAERKAAEEAAAQEKAARERAAQEMAAREKADTERAAAIATKPGEAGSSDVSLRDEVTGLEGRIDELGDEIAKLRERLESPKNESRAAPEEAGKSAASGVDAASTQIVVATVLHRRLEAGRPYAHELSALKRLGAEPGPLDALARFAEKGAPTAASLHAEFSRLAKKLHEGRAPAEESPVSGDLTEKLLQSASKLVKVHPTGQAPDDSFEGRVARVEAALAHKDLAGAEAAFDALPDAAKAEAKSFGEDLHARREAEDAAETLLAGAIEAVGASK